VKQKMTSKLITIKSSPLTNCSKSITNRFKQNEKWSYWPAWTTWLKETYKLGSLTSNSQICNCKKQRNTLSQSKTGSPCNCRLKRHQSKRITNNQKKKLCRNPYSSCFAIRYTSPSSRLTICINFSQMRNLFFCVIPTVCIKTPFYCNTFLCLSIPKKKYRFTKTRKCIIYSSSIRMIRQVRSSLNSNCKCYSNKQIIRSKKASNKRLVNTYYRYTMPSFITRGKERNISHRSTIFQIYTKIHFTSDRI
jgi:hypothetical protein